MTDMGVPQQHHPSEDGSMKTEDDVDAAYEIDDLAEGKPRKKRRVIRTPDKKYLCPSEDCGKSYSRAEHLYRHQLNRGCTCRRAVSEPLPLTELQTRRNRSIVVTFPVVIVISSAPTSAHATRNDTPPKDRISSAKTPSLPARGSLRAPLSRLRPPRDPPRCFHRPLSQIMFLPRHERMGSPQPSAPCSSRTMQRSIIRNRSRTTRNQACRSTLNCL